MDLDSAVNDANEEHSELAEADDSCRFEFIEIVPLARDTDTSCATVSAEVKQENLTDVKEEPDHVCCVISVAYSLSFVETVVSLYLQLLLATVNVICMCKLFSSLGWHC